MTVFSAESPSYSHYYVNDVININDKFNISFPFLEEPQYVRVYLITDEGKGKDLDLGVHYKVVLSNGISNVWGQVQILSLIESVKEIYIVRNIKNDQNQAFNSQTIFANTVERAFDKLTMLNQDILLNEIEQFVHVAYNESINIGALQLPSATERANTTLQFDENGAILCQKSWDERKSIHTPYDEELDNKLQLPPANQRANTTLQFDENGAIKLIKNPNASVSFLYVSAKKGNDTNNNGLSPNTPKRTIYSALLVASQMQSSHMIDIFVEGDEYNEYLFISTKVNIHADNATLRGFIEINSDSILNFNKITANENFPPSNNAVISIYACDAEINIKYVEDIGNHDFICVSRVLGITRLTANLRYVNLKSTLISVKQIISHIDSNYDMDVNININNLKTDNDSFMFINSNNTEDHAPNCINLYIKRCSISNITKSFLVNLLNPDNYIVIRCEQFLAQVRELNVNVIGALYMNLGLVDGDYTLTNHTENAKVYLDYVYDANK